MIYFHTGQLSFSSADNVKASEATPMALGEFVGLVIRLVDNDSSFTRGAFLFGRDLFTIRVSS